MSSTLACIGLAVDDLDALADIIDGLPGELVGRTGGTDTVRHADPSGSRLLISRRDGEVVGLVPSFAAAPGALVSGLAEQAGLVSCDVVDADGETATRFLVDLEQVRHLDGDPGTLQVSVVALAVEMQVHADADSFAASDASVLDDGDDTDAPRWAAESFVSYGLFRTEDPEPTAFLAGTVLAVETREHSVSGQAFHAARVRTAGFEATVCLAASEHTTAPSPGNVIAGACYLVVDAPRLWAIEVPPKRKWWRPVD